MKMKQRPEEFWQIGPMGREILEYWEQEKPELVQEMTAAGTLWEYLEKEDERLYDLGLELMRSGLSEDQMMEVLRAEFQS